MNKDEALAELRRMGFAADIGQDGNIVGGTSVSEKDSIKLYKGGFRIECRGKKVFAWVLGPGQLDTTCLYDTFDEAGSSLNFPVKSVWSPELGFKLLIPPI